MGRNRIVFGHQRAQAREENSTMKADLIIRRQKLLGELAQVDRQIIRTQKQLAHIETQIARASKSREKAA